MANNIRVSALAQNAGRQLEGITLDQRLLDKAADRVIRGGLFTAFCIAPMELSMLGEVGAALWGGDRAWTHAVRRDTVGLVCSLQRHQVSNDY